MSSKCKEFSPVLDEDISTSGFVSLEGSSVMSDTSHIDDDVAVFDEVGDNLTFTEMKKEENRLREKNEREIEKERREFMKEQMKKEIKERRYASLMNLLEKSQFYAKFAITKIESADTGKRKGKKKRKALEEYSSEIKSALKKQKMTSSPEAREATTVLTENSEKLQKISSQEREMKTKVTSLGVVVPEEQPALLTGTALRDYQLEGVDWLKKIFLSGLNGILADEMGLGKTIQMIGFLCYLYEVHIPGPFLIVAPLSTLPNWLHEFTTFAPDLPIVLYHGNAEKRLSLQKKIDDSKTVLGYKCFPVVITSFELPVRDEYFFKRIFWKYIIVDEGHRIKNYKAQLSRCLLRLSTTNKVLLTGTPLQNNLTELWSLLHFLVPELFSDLNDFHMWFEVEEIENSQSTDHLLKTEKEKNILSTLHKILSPFLLRRVKSEVNLKLPPKKEVFIYCPMTDVQFKLYSAVVDKSIQKMKSSNKNGNLILPDNPDGSRVKRRCSLKPKSYSSLDLSDSDDEQATQTTEEINKDNNMLEVVCQEEVYHLKVKMSNPIMMLRQIASHPYLIQMPLCPDNQSLCLDDRIVSTSGKMLILDSLLSRLKKDNHKVLIFSTFTMILNVIEEYMEMKEYDYCRLDGSCKIEDRKDSIARFNTNPSVFAFLISTRAGGLGINLTAADTVIIFDSDWNPQVDLQAMDRCHRIGQDKPVMVYRLITSGTVDERIINRSVAKKKLEKMVIDAGNFKYSKATDKELFNLESLKQLLEEKKHSNDVYSVGTGMTEEQWASALDRSEIADG